MGGNAYSPKVHLSGHDQARLTAHELRRARMLCTAFPRRSGRSWGVGAVHAEKRKHQRIHVALPVFLKDATGVTRDVSASGMFFWTAGAYAPGELIGFEVELRRPAGKMRLKCRGDVIRAESGSARVGIAVEIMESEMEQA